MQSITFECEVITPMFLSGADGCTPELRPPSIKGALRFWWRAMNGHLTLEAMKKIEGEIFGDTSQKSKVIIIVSEQPKQENIEPAALLPHKTHSSKPDSIKAKTTFNIELRLVKLVQLSNEKNFALKDLENLFIIAITLGGWGKRSRRGFGSVTIRAIKKGTEEWESFQTPQSLDEIYSRLPPQYFFKNEQDDKIESRFYSGEKYPFIKQIQIGRKQSSLLLKIADTTNRFHRSDFNNYGASLGKAIGGRLASPIFVSIIVNRGGATLPIITTLNTTSNNVSLQERFKNNIL